MIFIPLFEEGNLRHFAPHMLFGMSVSLPKFVQTNRRIINPIDLKLGTVIYIIVQMIPIDSQVKSQGHFQW